MSIESNQNREQTVAEKAAADAQTLQVGIMTFKEDIAKLDSQVIEAADVVEENGTFILGNPFAPDNK